jgi:hypothetical protein
MTYPQEAIDAAADVIARKIFEAVPADEEDRMFALAVLDAVAPFIAVWKLSRAELIAQRAEEIHAEHHPGYVVPSLDSCTEHTRAEYETLVTGLLADVLGPAPEAP